MRKCFRGLKAIISIAVAFAMIMTMALCTAVVKADDEETKVTATIKKIWDFPENAKSWPYADSIPITTPEKLYVVTSDGTINELNNTYGIDWTSCGNPAYINGDCFYGHSNDKDNKYRIILKADGTPYGNMDDFYISGFVGNVADGSYWYLDNSNNLHIETKSGSNIMTKDISAVGEPNGVTRLGDYYIVSMTDMKIKVYDLSGNDCTPATSVRPSETLLSLSYVAKQNTVRIRYSYSYDIMNPDADDFFFDKNLNSVNEAAFNSDSELDMKVKDYKGYKRNYDGEIAGKVPTGFNYSGEIYLSGDWYGVASQSKEGMQIGVLYDTAGNILVSEQDFGQTPLAGPYFLKSKVGDKSVYKIEIVKPKEPESGDQSEPQATEVKTEIEGFSDDAKVVDEDGNEVDIKDVVIKAVEAIQEQVEHAKLVLEEKGIVIPTNAHVDFFEVDITGKDGKVLKMADGSVRFFVEVRDDIDPTKFTVKAYHVLPDNTCEEVSVEWVDGKPCVTATSFSPYVIVYEPIPVKSPATGDNANILLMVLLLASAVIAGTIFMRRHRV